MTARCWETPGLQHDGSSLRLVHDDKPSHPTLGDDVHSGNTPDELTHSLTYICILLGMADIRAHFTRDPWERHKIELTLNNAEVRGLDTSHSRAVENLRLTLTPPKRYSRPFVSTRFTSRNSAPNSIFDPRLGISGCRGLTVLRAYC